MNYRFFKLTFLLVLGCFLPTATTPMQRAAHCISKSTRSVLFPIALFSVTYLAINGLIRYWDYQQNKSTQNLFDALQPHENVTALKTILHQGIAIIHAKDQEGRTPLLLVIQQTLEIVEIAQDKNSTLLSVDQIINQLSKITLLLDANSSLDACDNKGNSCRDYLKTLFIRLIRYPAESTTTSQQKATIETLKHAILDYCYTSSFHKLRTKALARLTSHIW